MSAGHLPQTTVEVACTCVHLWHFFFHFRFFGVAFGGIFFGMGNKGKHVALLGCKNNWISFLAQESEGGAVTKTQSKAGRNRDMYTLSLAKS